MFTEFLNSTYTKDFIIGVKNNGFVYAYIIKINETNLTALFKSRCKSRKTLLLRYFSNKEKIELLENIASQKILVDNEDHFNISRRKKINKQGKIYTENRGEYFEYAIAKKLNASQNTSPTTPHTVAGDITLNGISYQVKFEGSGIKIGTC